MTEPAVIHGRGTPESVWRTGLPEFPELSLASCRHLVLVAPHPDDEVLGVGGTAAILAAAGVNVTVVSVTDGGASHPGSPTYAPHDLERIRRLETIRAGELLGLAPPRRLGVPDGRVADHEDDVVDELVDLVASAPGGVWCAAPWHADGHPDHEATARAAVRATRTTGSVLVEYPIWMWHWATPGDDRVPWERARSVSLPRAIAEAKKAAIAEFTSQTHDLSDDPADRAILPPWVVERFVRPTEVMFV